MRACLVSDAFLKYRWPTWAGLRCCLNLLEKHEDADGGGVQKMDFLASHTASFANPGEQLKGYLRLKLKLRAGCRVCDLSFLPVIQVNPNVQVTLPVDGDVAFDLPLAGLLQPIPYLNP